MPHTLLAQATYGVFTVLCLFAVGQGARWEKITGVLLLVVNIVTAPLQDRIHWMDPQARLLIEDVLVLLFLLALAMRYGRGWMMFAAAFQLLSTLSHPAAHFARQVGPVAYLTIVQIFSYGVYLSLGAGVLIQALARLNRGGEAGRVVRPPG